jgi:hypothetical protein
MPDEILAKLEAQEKKLDDIHRSVEKLRKYFQWTLIITVLTVVLPIIGLIVIIPWFLKIMTAAYAIN